jgi:hypothetical protein
MENSVEGFSLSGEEVLQLTDKHFVISKEPYYEEFEKDGKKTKKLIIPVKLVNGIEVEWIANKTSQKQIIAAKGRILNKWIGFKGEFVVKNQVVGKEEKAVIYIK